MTKSKQIRGILDYISLKPGEEFEWEPISESYVPGRHNLTEDKYLEKKAAYEARKAENAA